MKTKFSKFLFGKAFPICFYLFLLLVMAYFVFRTGCTMEQLWGIRGYGWVSLTFLAFFLLHLLVRNKGKFPPLYRFWLQLEGLLICFLIYFLVSLLGCDLIGLLVSLFTRSEWIFAISWCTAVGITLLCVLYGVFHARRLKTVPYKIVIGKQGRSYRMVLLSDLHIGVFVGPGYIQKVVSQVNALSPDIVVIAGDIFDNGYVEEAAQPDRISELLRGIRAKDGVFAVLGNHDPAYSNEKLQSFLKDAHIRLLYNEVYSLPCMYLAGRNDMLHRVKYAEPRTPLKELLADLEKDRPVVILDHNPDGIDEAAECRADLVLCGHNHKGQFFPLNIFTRLSHQKNHFYGQERFGKTQAIISAGTGYFQLPVRVGTNSEIVNIVLKL